MLKRALAVTLSLVSAVTLAQTSATTTVTPLPAIEADLDRFLIAYENDGLRLFALMVKPKETTGPLPVVIANHGFHPNPPRYGFVDDDRNERPGKYYGAVPTAFARLGYAVVMADYRGHNTSEGYEFTRMANAPDLYANDVRALLRLLPSFKGLRTDCMFMWGHSMGAHVSLRVMLAHPGIRAVSLWSLASPVKDWSAALDAARPSPPVALRHSIGDPVTPVENSRNLVDLLVSRGIEVESSFEKSTTHLFEGLDFEKAIQADASFFSKKSSSESCNSK